jgi:hypothetical protein
VNISIFFKVPRLVTQCLYALVHVANTNSRS